MVACAIHQVRDEIRNVMPKESEDKNGDIKWRDAIKFEDKHLK
jgi:hypothetical protein